MGIPTTSRPDPTRRPSMVWAQLTSEIRSRRTWVTSCPKTPWRWMSRVVVTTRLMPCQRRARPSSHSTGSATIPASTQATSTGAVGNFTTTVTAAAAATADRRAGPRKKIQCGRTSTRTSSSSASTRREIGTPPSVPGGVPADGASPARPGLLGAGGRTGLEARPGPPLPARPRGRSRTWCTWDVRGEARWERTTVRRRGACNPGRRRPPGGHRIDRAAGARTERGGGVS